MYKIGRDKVMLSGMKNIHANTSTGEVETVSAMRTELELAEEMAEAIRNEAQRQAEEIRRAAEEEAQALKNEAWEVGYNDGRYEANKKMKDQLAEGAGDIARLLEEIRSTRNAMFDQCETEMVRLCLETVKTVLGQSIGKDASMFTSMITRVLNRMRLEGKILIKVSPREYKQFFSEGSATFALRDGEIVADIEEDASLGTGGLIIQSDRETVDAGIDTQLRYISLAFEKAAGDGK